MDVLEKRIVNKENPLEINEIHKELNLHFERLNERESTTETVMVQMIKPSSCSNLKANVATVGSLVTKQFNALSGENKKGLVIIVRSLVIPMLIVFNFLGEMKMVKVIQVLQDKGLRDHQLM